MPGREQGLRLVLLHSVGGAAGVEGLQFLALQGLPVPQLQLQRQRLATGRALADRACKAASLQRSGC